MTSGQSLVREHLLSKTAHPVFLHMLFSEHWGAEYLYWEPETIQSEVLSTFRVTLPRYNFSKLQAVRTFLRTAEARTSWHIFNHSAKALSGESPIFGVFEPATPPQCVIALNVLDILLPEEPVSDEVLKFCAVVCAQSGVCLVRGLNRVGSIQSRINGHLRELTDPKTQDKTLGAIRAGRKALFDGNNALDIQVFHARSLDQAAKDDFATMHGQLTALSIL